MKKITSNFFNLQLNLTTENTLYIQTQSTLNFDQTNMFQFENK
jgi:hypothetical protein